jgi:hypothetical protein
MFNQKLKLRQFLKKVAEGLMSDVGSKIRKVSPVSRAGR